MPPLYPVHTAPYVPMKVPFCAWVRPLYAYQELLEHAAPAIREAAQLQVAYLRSCEAVEERQRAVAEAER
jgi:hypothetical protein